MIYQVTFRLTDCDFDSSVVLDAAHDVADMLRLLLDCQIEDDDTTAEEIEGPSEDECDQGVILRIARHDDEFCVQYWHAGYLDPAKCYYTDDEEDAVETRKAMAREVSDKLGLIAFCPKWK